jgi:phage tail P2-like protein
MSKSIYDAEYLDRLPEALTYDPKVVALAAIVSADLQEVSGEMQQATIYERIDELSERVLDVLAYDFNVDMYDYTYPIETKRNIIKNSFKSSRIKGTRYATEQALKAIWENSEIEEWFEYDGKPFHFRVVCDIGNAEVLAGNKAISEAIRKQKRLSAHIEEIIFQCVISCVIKTKSDCTMYETPLTGKLAAGTHPQRNIQGGNAASVVIVNTGADYFAFTSPQAGTIPGRNIIFRQAETQITAETGANAYRYTNIPAGQIKAGETPQRSVTGDTESGVLESKVSAAGFKYSVKVCGSSRKL